MLKRLIIPVYLRYALAAFTLTVLFVVGAALLSPIFATGPAKACPPSGKCVTTTRYCLPGQECSKNMYKLYKGYCSPAVGCFTWEGNNYVYNKDPNPLPND